MITENDIKKIASLGKLDITSEEISNLKENFSSIFEYFSVLDKIDLEKNNYLSNYKTVSDSYLREDFIKQNDNNINLLKNSSNSKNNEIIISGIKNR